MDDLNIARIRAYVAIPPLMPAARYSGPEHPSRMNIEIIRLTLANGMEGTASFASGWDQEQVGVVVDNIREISPRVIGQNVAHRTTLTESLLAEANEGPWPAISLIDCAMWDAYAQSTGKPLWKLLGGHQERIEAYASTAAFLTIEEYLEDAQKLMSLGYRAIKFHMNTDPDFDLAMVRAVAKAHHGNDLRFMVDLEQYYTFDQAVRLGEALADLPFDWMEAPLPDRDLEAYIELNRAIPIDVIPAGNTLVGMENWSAALSRKAWSRLRCDASYAGGITMVRKAMGLARSMNIPVELQSFGFQPEQHANLHLLLGLGGSTWFEHPAPSAPYDYATRNPTKLDALGRIGAADGPGLGLDIDWVQISADAFLTFDSMD